MRPNGISNQGSAILIVLVLLAVCTFCIIASSESVTREAHATGTVRLISERDSLSTQIRRLAQLDLTYYATLNAPLGLGNNVNQQLLNCLIADTPAVDCYANRPHPMQLVSVTDGTTFVTGSPNNPVWYNENGQTCGPRAPASCQLFAVTTVFQAHCPGGVTQCAQADSITVTYTVQLKHQAVSTSNAEMGLNTVTTTLASLPISSSNHGIIPARYVPAPAPPPGPPPAPGPPPVAGPAPAPAPGPAPAPAPAPPSHPGHDSCGAGEVPYMGQCTPVGL